MYRIGVISDTHGLLRPEALRALQRADLIVHAGDIGDPQILDDLRSIAPTIAVRGNVDTGAWARALPETTVAEIGGRRLYVLHDIARLAVDPHASRFAAVIYGHSHRATADVRQHVLYLNPGSAGPRRFRLPITVATLRIDRRAVTHELIELEA